MFKSGFDKILDTATSHLRLEPDWPTILQICDLIRQNECSPKQAINSIKKKAQTQNPHTALYSLVVLESVVKNCGTPVHEEISTKENCEFFTQFIEKTPYENVRNKMLELIQAWAHAFRSNYKYRAIRDTMNILKSSGYKFPELKEADEMFKADTAPEWVDSPECNRCRTKFSLTVRRHHCRNCGQIFCDDCSSKTMPLPRFGYEKDVRVCDGCYVQLHSQQTAPAAANSKSRDDDLPTEYLSSGLTQQPQSPPKKTEQELKEEEELQLALALSQSEAEAKEKSKYQSARESFTSYEPVVQSPSYNDDVNDPELAKYLNRDYWEQKRMSENIASPSAPSPMSSKDSPSILTTKQPDDTENEIDEFANNMKVQVEIFVNRMKSDSSRGRSISADSAVQTLFLNLSTLHSKLLGHIKDMDDKRMSYERLQDKLTQIRDSRGALDALRSEHRDKLRRMAEEQERQRQIQMAQKLEIMRQKKQEYLQYQRQLALQRIQEQEIEMQMRQEQHKAMYKMGGAQFMPIQVPGGSPMHYGALPQMMNNQMPGMNYTAAPGMPGINQQIPKPGMPGMVSGLGNPTPDHYATLPNPNIVPPGQHPMQGQPHLTGQPQMPGFPHTLPHQAGQPNQQPPMMTAPPQHMQPNVSNTHPGNQMAQTHPTAHGVIQPNMRQSIQQLIHPMQQMQLQNQQRMTIPNQPTYQPTGTAPQQPQSAFVNPQGIPQTIQQQQPISVQSQGDVNSVNHSQSLESQKPSVQSIPQEQSNNQPQPDAVSVTGSTVGTEVKTAELISFE